jgi:hypothetical protein
MVGKGKLIGHHAPVNTDLVIGKLRFDPEALHHGEPIL